MRAVRDKSVEDEDKETRSEERRGRKPNELSSPARRQRRYSRRVREQTAFDHRYDNALFSLSPLPPCVTVPRVPLSL